jgi:hypothetical protein
MSLLRIKLANEPYHEPVQSALYTHAPARTDEATINAKHQPLSFTIYRRSTTTTTTNPTESISIQYVTN